MPISAWAGNRKHGLEGVLRLALSLASDIHVVQILDEEMKTEDLTRAWPELVEKPTRNFHRKPPQLVVRPSAYRQFFRPLLNYLRELIMKEAIVSESHRLKRMVEPSGSNA